MGKIYGYREKDIRGLLEFIKTNDGRSLTEIFALYAIKTGKSKGTVRNMYYALAVGCKKDGELSSYFGLEKQLQIHEVKEFSEAEIDGLIEKIVIGKKSGKSVRKIIFEIAEGNGRLALRLQNKYRNILSKDRGRILEVAKRQGCEHLFENKVQPEVEKGSFSFNRLKREIDLLCLKIGEKVRKENEQLKEKVERLTSENLFLKSKLLEVNGEKSQKSKNSAIDFFCNVSSKVGKRVKK